MSRKIEKIYVHCSASEWGTVEEITRWHRERGWKTIGYHWLITNIWPTYASIKEGKPVGEYDGRLWVGRPVNQDDFLEPKEVGAHVAGENAYSLGICLVGDDAFSSKQIDTLVEHCAHLCFLHKLPVSAVRGHYEFWKDKGLTPAKSCPNLPMDAVRKQVEEEMNRVRSP